MKSTRDKRYRDHKRAILDRLKTIKGCAHCGYRENPFGLQFDHIDPKTKEFAIAGNIAIGWNKIRKEIKKCQVLCGTCHNIKTVCENRGLQSP